MTNREKIIDLLKQVKREGIEELIQAMDEGGFFEAPCSGAYHLSKEGGLAEHSLNVYNALFNLNYTMCADLDYDSMLIVALLHDLGKMGDHGKPNYVLNILKSGKVSDAKPYETNKDLYYEEHEIRSVIIAERYITLSEEEESAILHHNGLFGKLDSSFGNHGFDRDKLAFLLHTADMYVSRFKEE